MIKLMMSSVATEDGTDMKEEDDSDGDEDYVRVHDMFSRIMQPRIFEFFKCDELASRTFKDLNFLSFLLALPQNLDKNQYLDKQINSFHIQIAFCYQLTLKM